MDGILKRNTAITIKLGPFVDEIDGDTLEEGLTIAQADVRLSKNGGNMAQKAGATGCTHDEIGMYDCPLIAADVSTRGLLAVNVDSPGALPVKQTYMIMDEVAYAVLYEASGTWSVSLTASIVPKKNTALANFPFVMFDSGSGAPKTGLTVAATRSINGGMFGDTANNPVEIGNGAYKIDLDDTDLNGDTIILRFIGTGANDQLITIVTQP